MAIVDYISKNNNYLEEYIKTHVIDETELSEQIIKFGVLERVIENKVLKNKIANDILVNILPEITVDNLTTYLDFIKPIQKSLELSNVEFIKKIISNITLLNEADKEKLYISIIKANYSQEDALLVVNIYDDYLNKIVSNQNIFVNNENDLAVNCQTLNERLTVLKNMLGINSITDYAINTHYNMEDLISNYITFEEFFSKIKKYRKFSENNVREIERYNNIIKPIYEYAIIEKQASYRPDKITFEFVKNKISKGDLRSAIADIVIKIDYEITQHIDNEYKDLDLYDKINMAEQKKYITKLESSILHNIRMFRNQLLHPCDYEIKFDIDKIKMWNEFVLKKEEK